MSWYVEVRHSAKPRYSKHVERGGKVTVKYDPEVYAQARLAKVVANAVKHGRTMSPETQARMLESFKVEAMEMSHV
jgi:hypothetical protein